MSFHSRRRNLSTSACGGPSRLDGRRTPEPLPAEPGKATPDVPEATATVIADAVRFSPGAGGYSLRVTARLADRPVEEKLRSARIGRLSRWQLRPG
jgi:hypothetical protein